MLTPTRFSICRLYKDCHVSMMKRKMSMNICNEEPTNVLENAGTEVGMYHTTMWNFSKRELKRYSYKLGRREEAADLYKKNKVPLARYCRSEFK